MAGIKLPPLEAFRISLEQIRRNLKRSSLTIASIALGLAFMTHFSVANLILRGYGEQSGITVEAYQSWLVAVSLFVSSIGLTNSALIAIYERYREIGTMKSLGALDRHILELFLLEGIIYGLAGSILGFMIGVISALITTSAQVGFGALANIPFLSLLHHLSLTIGLALVLSLIAIVYPAYRATKLRPVEALAYEV